jgi:hypothetical protein
MPYPSPVGRFSIRDCISQVVIKNKDNPTLIWILNWVEKNEGKS